MFVFKTMSRYQFPSIKEVLYVGWQAVEAGRACTRDMRPAGARSPIDIAACSSLRAEFGHDASLCRSLQSVFSCVRTFNTSVVYSYWMLRNEIVFVSYWYVPYLIINLRSSTQLQVSGVWCLCIRINSKVWWCHKEVKYSGCVTFFYSREDIFDLVSIFVLDFINNYS